MTDNTTPLQQAIQLIKARIPKRPYSDFEDGLERAYEEAVEELQSLLPKEKEFAEKCFDAGCEYGDSNCELGGNSVLPNRIQFINQLYPEK